MFMHVHACSMHTARAERKFAQRAPRSFVLGLLHSFVVAPEARPSQ